MEANVVPESIAMSAVAACAECFTELTSNNTAYWTTDRELCRDCAATIRGQSINEHVAALLSRGHIMVAYYSKDETYNLRVEIRASDKEGLDALARYLRAGRVYQHSNTVYRWSVTSKKDLFRIAQILSPHLPLIAEAIQRCVLQPTKRARSAFAEAITIKVGSRSIRLLEHLKL